MRQFTFAVAILVGTFSCAEVNAQFKKKPVEPGVHAFELKSPDGSKRVVSLVKDESEPVMRVKRDELFAAPMEFFTVPTDLATGESPEPGARVKEKAETVKFVLKLSGKVIDAVSDKSDFLRDFVDRVPCLHPTTGKEVAFKDFLKHYVTANGYVEAGYFDGSDLDKDPVGVFLRLLLFDILAIRRRAEFGEKS